MELSIIKEYIRHDQDGLFYWVRRNPKNSRACMGGIAGKKEANGYIRISIGGRRYLAHRLAWALAYGEWPSSQIDHIDGDRANNKICNLRLATNGQNGQNKDVAGRNNRSGLQGVSKKTKGSFQANIMANGVNRYLGSYPTAEDAHMAYKKAKLDLHEFYQPR